MPFATILGVVAPAVIQGLMGQDSARHAANVQEDAQKRAADIQQQQYNQTRADNLPRIQLGQGAANRLSQAYGFNTGPSREEIRNRLLAQYTKAGTPNQLGASSRLSPMDGRFGMTGMAAGFMPDNPNGFGIQDTPGGMNSTVDEAGLNAAIDAEMAKNQPGKMDLMSIMGMDPGYGFRQQQGQLGIDRKVASGGGYFSGAALKGAADFNSNLASQEFGNSYNRLAGMAGIGQTASNATSQAGMAAASNQGNYLSNIGDAQASGYINQGNALTSALNNGYGMYKDWKSRQTPGGLSQSEWDRINSTPYAPGYSPQNGGDPWGGNY
jgi:hypothetical protein